MEEPVYNVLWIDDEHETLDGLKTWAKINRINLMPFKSLNAGMEELEKNFTFYDGVLFDAKIYENEGDAKGTEDTLFVHEAKDRLLQIEKKFEVFVLTGQAEAFRDKTFNKAFKNVYEKASDEDLNRLFGDIKSAADQQEDTRIRFQHRRVFQVCDENYIGSHAAKDMLALLKAVENSGSSGEFIQIRKVMEDLFRAFSKYELLPQEFVAGTVALTDSSKFLAGKETLKGYTHLQDSHLPHQIAEHCRNIIQITNPAAHRSSADALLSELNTPYLFNSTVFLLCELLAWFKIYIDSSPRRNNWLKVQQNDIADFNNDYLTGRVAYIHPMGYGFFKPDSDDEQVLIAAKLIVDHALNVGDTIFVELGEYYSNKHKDKKMCVKKIKR
jgi:hypothetical protein